MNNVYFSNTKSILKTKTFLNYILILILTFFISILLLSLNNYNKYRIDNFINNEANKTINVNLNDNVTEEDVIKILNRFEITDITYSLIIDNYNINENSFNIMSYEKFDEDDYAIKISADYNYKAIKIFGNQITKINFIDNMDKNTIIINQKLSKKILSFKNTGIVNITLKNYKDIDSALNLLISRNINANKNIVSTDNMIFYTKLKSMLHIFLIITIICISAMIIYTNISIIVEQKRNIKIYHNIGYTKNNIVGIYFISNLIIVFIIHLLCSFLLFLLLLFLNFIGFVNQMLIISFLKTFYIPLFFTIIINGIINILNLIFIKKFI